MPNINENLESIAIEFRNSETPKERFIVALKYEREVNRLIANRDWKTKPENVLPDEWMPLSFYRYWKL